MGSFSKVVKNGPDGGFQGFQLAVRAGADHLHHSPLELIGAGESGTYHLRDDLFPWAGDVHLPFPGAQPGFAYIEDTADV